MMTVENALNPLLKHVKLARILHRSITMPDFSVVFHPTFYCNYKCSYCYMERKLKVQERFPEVRPWKDWLVLLRFPPATIHITGGEPFTYSGLIPLMKSLSRKHMFILATNLSMPIDDFVNNIDKSKIVYINASYHPHFAKYQEFYQKVQRLKESGFNICASLVATPSLIPRLHDLVRRLEEKGIGVVVQPYYDPNYHYTKWEVKLVRSYTEELNFGDAGIVKECLAGTHHFMVVPNGDVYACYSGFIHECRGSTKGRFRLGNLFDGSFMRERKITTCSLECKAICDWGGALVEEKGRIELGMVERRIKKSVIIFRDKTKNRRASKSPLDEQHTLKVECN